MSRVLVDTNVFISALVFGGNPALALQLIEVLGIEIAISTELESELADTLSTKFGWTGQRIEQARLPALSKCVQSRATASGRHRTRL